MGSAKKAGRPLKDRPAVDHVPNPKQTGDSKFARALGSGDFHTRDKGLKALTLWLQRQATVPDNALMKIWQGIFYCFWHSDKAHVQEDLAKRLASIFTQLNDEVAQRYFKAFLATMHREWARIDRLRLDKFMMMVRKFLEQLFACMAEQEWEKGHITKYMKMLHEVVFHEEEALAPVGFALHVADVFLPELLRTSTAKASTVPGKRGIALLKPFVSVLATTHQPALIARVRSSVFEALASELSKPSEGAPLKAVDAQQLSSALLAAGARADVRHRNRAALYELSQRFENIEKKRKRSGGAPDDAADEAPAKRPKAAQPADTPPTKKRAKAKGSLVLMPSSTPAAPAADAATASNGAAAAKTPGKKGGKDAGKHGAGGGTQATEEPNALRESNGAAADTPKKQQKQQQQRETVEEKLKESNGAHEEVAAGKKKKRRRSAPAAIDAEEGDTQAGSDALLSSAPPKAAAALGSTDLAPARLIKPAGASRSSNGSSAPSEVGEVEQAALANAIKAVSSARKSIHFNLRKNMVHQIGQPLPPAELRTPPRARPHGSALKKVSSLPVPKPDAAVSRRLSFSSARRNKATDFI